MKCTTDKHALVLTVCNADLPMTLRQHAQQLLTALL
jgi:hypothetical protein